MKNLHGKNVLFLTKGEEKYLFLFSDSDEDKLRKQLGIFAVNPDLNFSWFDAAVLSQKIKPNNNKEEEL